MRWEIRSKQGKNVTAWMFYVLFGVILAAFFILAVFLKIKYVANDSTFHKKFYSKDIALVVDALYAANGELVLKYDMNPPANMSLDVSLYPDTVVLTDRSDKSVDVRPKTSFFFGANNFTKVIPVTVNISVPDFDIINYNHQITFRFSSGNLPPASAGNS
jgi:hypothetical protein